MKSVKLVQELTRKALNRGEAHQTRNGSVVYEAYSDFKVFTLKHYGTTILKYDMVSRTIIEIGGYSASDRDAINNALAELGHTYTEQVRIRQGCLELA